MKLLKKITNGMLLVFIGLLHTYYSISNDAFATQFQRFSQTHYYKICRGVDELPSRTGFTDFESFSAFWFFYFGIFIIPLGLLLHSIEK